MANFVGSHDDSGETAGVFDDGHAVDLFKSFVDHTGSTDVGESCSSAIAIVRNEFTSTHVQFSDGHGDVIDRQTPFLEQVFSHVRQGGRRVDGVASDAILLKVRRRVASPGDDDTGDADANFRSFEQLVPQVDAVPEGDEIFFDFSIVPIVQSVSVVVDDDQNFRVNGRRGTAFLSSKRRARFEGSGQVHFHQSIIAFGLESSPFVDDVRADAVVLSDRTLPFLDQVLCVIRQGDVR